MVAWHDEIMAKPSAPKRDFMQVGRAIVERAIGEQMDGKPLETSVDARNPRKVEAGRLGGLRGGKARAKKLSSSKRQEIARKAAEKRWKSEQ
jgi:hypothetical protein